MINLMPTVSSIIVASQGEFGKRSLAKGVWKTTIDSYGNRKRQLWKVIARLLQLVLAEKSRASFSTEWEAKPIAPCTRDIYRVLKIKWCYLTSVVPSVMKLVQMEADGEHLTPPLSISAPFYGCFKIYGSEESWNKHLSHRGPIGPRTSRSKSCALANWATAAPLLAWASFN